MHYVEHSSALKLVDRLVMVDPSGESRASWPLPQGALCTGMTNTFVCNAPKKKYRLGRPESKSDRIPEKEGDGEKVWSATRDWTKPREYTGKG